jgi:sec-independent protein translocase protein TatB
MFDIGWGELVVIGIVALIAIGPKELPGVLRMVGQWVGKIRRMAGEFQNQFHEAMREAELSELRKEVDEMAAHAANFTTYDPIADVRKEVESAQRDVENAVMAKPPAETPAASEESPAALPSSGTATLAAPAHEAAPSVPDGNMPAAEPAGPAPAPTAAPAVPAAESKPT